MTDPTSWPPHRLGRQTSFGHFPAIPLDQVQEFAKQHCHAHRRLVVLGSTSAYDRHEQPTMDLPPWIDETSPINADLPAFKEKNICAPTMAPSFFAWQASMVRIAIPWTGSGGASGPDE